MRPIIVIALTFPLLAAACGPPGPKKYNEAKTRACVIAQHLKVSAPPATDFIANTALGGSFRAKFRDRNWVTVSFGDTVDNAKQLDVAYREVAAKNVGIEDVLRSDGNAVMLWHEHPSDADLALLQGCLKT